MCFCKKEKSVGQHPAETPYIQPRERTERRKRYLSLKADEYAILLNCTHTVLLWGKAAGASPRPTSPDTH